MRVVFLLLVLLLLLPLSLSLQAEDLGELSANPACLSGLSGLFRTYLKIEMRYPIGSTWAKRGYWTAAFSRILHTV